ncbi:unnamed protein product [Pseudo-nitzschia multistriata]|uniref:Uncharacterized protein n=1 Tax=Pseudo-nitzschia multistriata TaxID=183589 RepID=A0A448Z999_9STRA|nr:unnamed protein product [Pseudo-nitzschia multistriata]
MVTPAAESTSQPAARPHKIPRAIDLGEDHDASKTGYGPNFFSKILWDIDDRTNFARAKEAVETLVLWMTKISRQQNLCSESGNRDHQENSIFQKRENACSVMREFYKLDGIHCLLKFLETTIETECESSDEQGDSEDESYSGIVVEKIPPEEGKQEEETRTNDPSIAAGLCFVLETCCEWDHGGEFCPPTEILNRGGMDTLAALNEAYLDRVVLCSAPERIKTLEWKVLTSTWRIFESVASSEDRGHDDRQRQQAFPGIFVDSAIDALDALNGYPCGSCRGDEPPSGQGTEAEERFLRQIHCRVVSALSHSLKAVRPPHKTPRDTASCLRRAIFRENLVVKCIQACGDPGKGTETELLGATVSFLTELLSEWARVPPIGSEATQSACHNRSAGRPPLLCLRPAEYRQIVGFARGQIEASPERALEAGVADLLVRYLCRTPEEQITVLEAYGKEAKLSLVETLVHRDLLEVLGDGLGTRKSNGGTKLNAATKLPGVEATRTTASASAQTPTPTPTAAAETPATSTSTSTETPRATAAPATAETPIVTAASETTAAATPPPAAIPGQHPSIPGEV